MRQVLLFISAILLFGCSDAVLPESTPEVVVEGWIEAGGPPVVMVSTTVPITEKWQDLEPVLESCVVRWATVSVHDGEKEVFLTGKFNSAYMPPYIYTTSRITGKVGQKYKLKVVYGGRTVESETVIPAPVRLEYVRPSEISDGRYEIKAGLRDDPQTKDYYKFFTKIKGKNSIHVPSFMGLVDDEVLRDEVSEIKVLGRFTTSFGAAETDTYFTSGDEVSIKFCTMSEDVYKYWEDFEDVSSLSLNPFFPVTRKIRSNIKGGLGYWAGYGSTYYSVQIP